MPDARSVWGLHIVAGSVTAALLRRHEDGSFEVETAFVEPAPPDDADSLATAADILRRRGLRGRPTIVALPDVRGVLGRATLPADKTGLTEKELVQELAEWTRFEAEDAEFRHVRANPERPAEQRLVAALPRGEEERALLALRRAGPDRLGLAFAGASTLRGVQALGLAGAHDAVVEVFSHVTALILGGGAGVERVLLAAGEADLRKDASWGEALTHDLAHAIERHASRLKISDAVRAEARLVPAGPAANSAAVRRVLASVETPPLSDVPRGTARVRFSPTAKSRDLPDAAFAGAVGAALEAFLPDEERLLLREVPTPTRSRRFAPVGVAAAAVTLVAAAVGIAVALRDGAARREETSRAAQQDESTTARADAPEARPTNAVAEKTQAADPDAATARTGDVVEARALEDGRVGLTWKGGRDGRRLSRSGPGDTWTPLRALPVEAGEWIDDVPGPSARYGFRIDDGEPVYVDVAVSVDVELVGPGESGGAKFSLRRSWRGADRTSVVETVPGAPIATSLPLDEGGVVLVLDPGLRLDAVRTRVETERAVVKVPRFRPDGRIERDEKGRPALVERLVKRERRVFEAEAVRPDGRRRTWSRKMTDG